MNPQLRNRRTLPNQSGWPEPIMQADAAVRGAADSYSLGLADEIAAGGDTLLGMGGSGGLLQRYETNLQRQRARDAYDALHRQVARSLGKRVADATLLVVPAESLGVGVTKALTSREKGLLGEGMSLVKTVVKGDWPAALQKRVPLSKSYTVADHVTAGGKVVEAKFGPAATLSKQQRLAAKELKPNYRDDWWLSKHLGYATGGVGGLLGFGLPPATDRRDKGR